ncbi:MAG: hypothetical protein EBV16_08970 [Betaproteobacteria bacterium]|nr:hypothetical protein [Betaproteobacteria bacterium]
MKKSAVLQAFPRVAEALTVRFAFHRASSIMYLSCNRDNAIVKSLRRRFEANLMTMILRPLNV